MISSHRAPDNVSCLQIGSTRGRVYCFWLVRSIRRIFPEYWTPAGQRRQQYPQLAIGPVPEHWLRGRLPGGQNYVQPHGDPLSSCTPGFSIKRIFPEYWSHGPGTHRTLLQYPHCLALPGCTAAGSTRHKSPVPIYPLGLDKTNFPRIPENIFVLRSGRN